MLTVAEIVADQASLGSDDVEWLQDLVREGQLVADLSLADIAIWVRTRDESWVSVALFRAATSSTVFYRDIVGTRVTGSWEVLLTECVRRGTMLEPTEPIWFEESPTTVRAIPIRRKGGADPIAVLTRHAPASERHDNRQAQTLVATAEQIYSMIADGDFPDPAGRDLPKLGAPRAADGFITVDREATVTYASPNALSLFNRLGYSAPLEGRNLGEVARAVANKESVSANETLAMIAVGRVPWQSDIAAEQSVVAVRGIPITQSGERVGAVMLLRDVTELRRQERELSSKNATIREIHHRVKNNLQTVASLLRIQGRRAKSPEATEALTQAMHRIEAIAVVHDTLSSVLTQSVNFDEVAQRVLPLAAEVATAGGMLRPTLVGSFGDLPPEFATPLAVVLTELITNAVEHGVAGLPDGAVTVRADRSPDRLTVSVEDNGRGVDEGTVGSGLGTTIIQTLVTNELSATIAWNRGAERGTVVTIEIPLKYIAQVK